MLSSDDGGGIEFFTVACVFTDLHRRKFCGGFVHTIQTTMWGLEKG
jgi:hypothetical protein